MYIGGDGGGGCPLKPAGSLDPVSPIFGDQFFQWSAGQSCGADQLEEIVSLDGVVSDRVASINVVLDDGRTIPMEITPLPTEWSLPYRAWVGAVESPPVGDQVGRPSLGEYRSGEFILRDAAGHELQRYVFAVGKGC
jgi:hypothetical protein